MGSRRYMFWKRWSRKWIWGIGLLAQCALAPLAQSEVAIGERPAVERHLDQQAIEAGEISFWHLLDHGEFLFDARFNTLDGQGRPAATGTGAKRSPDQPAFIRTSAPESNSCAGCHAQPRIGGAGDILANVFVLAQGLDPVTDSVSPEFSNERNTLGMFGAGPIEMLARELSSELIAIRTSALMEASFSDAPVRRELVAKGISFGAITVRPDERIDPSEIEGVDWDLIVKPFHQKGAVVSIREFTNNAMNHHHGIQSVERFGDGIDFDEDGYVNELTVGDVTAVTLFQAALPVPTHVAPACPARRGAAGRGQRVFDEVGCTSCHVRFLDLESRMFSEPNPFNPKGNLRRADVSRPYVFDMTRSGRGPHIRPLRGGDLLPRRRGP